MLLLPNMNPLSGSDQGRPFVGLKLNSEAFAPETMIEFTRRSDLPVFLILTVREADPPTFTGPRLTDMGLT